MYCAIPLFRHLPLCPCYFPSLLYCFRPAFRFWRKVDEKLLHLHLYREFLLLWVFHRSTFRPVLRHSIPHERRYDNFTRRFSTALFQHSVFDRKQVVIFHCVYSFRYLFSFFFRIQKGLNRDNT